MKYGVRWIWLIWNLIIFFCLGKLFLESLNKHKEEASRILLILFPVIMTIMIFFFFVICLVTFFTLVLFFCSLQVFLIYMLVLCSAVMPILVQGIQTKSITLSASQSAHAAWLYPSLQNHGQLHKIPAAPALMYGHVYNEWNTSPSGTI